MDDHIVPGRELSVTTSEEQLTFKQKAKCSASEALVKYSEEEKRVIEKLTRKQKDSVHWLKYSQGIITSPNFNGVANHSRVIARKGINQATVSLVAALLGGSLIKGNKATRYGQRQEQKAVAEYLALMKSSHKRCSVDECGLVISKEFDYLETS
ncbi:hypothetical protein DPMN_059508 [Dreissena polymorpha]|uniref:Uncharacterized protein n=1 Tax=Dreissena polymorpha TaxID=45954 RepID=A0A9D4HGN8_DREPO|nr:hypothetical protein DPMN_059508 [Dreissena polymorpha]